jgi:hypothetical protein
MGSKIPKPIKLEVIRKSLEGKSRNEIGKEVGLGAWYRKQRYSRIPTERS